MLDENLILAHVVPLIIEKFDWCIDFSTHDNKEYFTLEEDGVGYSETSEFNGTYVDVVNQIERIRDNYDVVCQADNWCECDAFSGEYSQSELMDIAELLAPELDDLSDKLNTTLENVAENCEYNNIKSFGEITDEYRIVPTLASEYIYKNPYMFYEFPDEVCYIQEQVFDRVPEDKNGGWNFDEVCAEGYTHNDLLTLCNNNEDECEKLFNALTWQSPEALVRHPNLYQ